MQRMLYDCDKTLQLQTNDLDVDTMYSNTRPEYVNKSNRCPSVDIVGSNPVQSLNFVQVFVSVVLRLHSHLKFISLMFE